MMWMMEATGTQRAAWSDVYESLVAYGAPLWNWAANARLGPEQTLVQALELAREDATVLRVLPVCLARLGEKLNWELFRREAAQRGQEAAAGFLLELTAELTHSSTLLHEADALRPAQPPKTVSFFRERSTHDRELAEARTPAVARRWGFLMNMTEESFRSVWERHRG